MIGRGSAGSSNHASSRKTFFDPLLKRPFSIFRRRSKGLEILYRVKGRGTMLMRDMKKGSPVSVLGPLGNSYPMPGKGRTPLIIAGGIGIASLFFLAHRFAKSGKKAHIYYGVRNEGELLMLDELKRFGKRLYISTDDGSCGEKGCVTDMLGDFLSGVETGPDYEIYACGPRAMLAALSGVVKDLGIPAYVSMEENMACGIGACLGCVVKTVNGHKRVCKEGPVFKMEEIIW